MYSPFTFAVVQRVPEFVLKSRLSPFVPGRLVRVSPERNYIVYTKRNAARNMPGLHAMLNEACRISEG